MDRSLEELIWRRAGRRCEYCWVSQGDFRLSFEIDTAAAIAAVLRLKLIESGRREA